MLCRTRFLSWLRPAAVLVCLFALAAPALASSDRGKRHDRKVGKHAFEGVRKGKRKTEKLDDVLKEKSKHVLGTSRVIVTSRPGADASREAKRLGGRLGRRLDLINSRVVELPNGALRALAAHPDVASLHFDRPAVAQMNRAAVTVGSRSAQYEWGYTGAGVGVAVIDSGVTSWHDDLGYTGWSSVVRTVNGQRVTGFVDFVQDVTTPYDDNGHGTHVAGIIAGNGYDSWGARAGIAPGAHLVSLKVLDAEGRGVISDVIAALEWAVLNRAAHNIRVVNLSVGARVTESFNTDPLTVAARRAVEAGLVVVAAAGNLGKNANGQVQYGGITAPGNAPWVLTVGASNSQGTVFRYDDVIAEYSSRGPSPVDYAAKPDLAAPGTGIVSLSDPNSTFYTTKSSYLLSGMRDPGYKPYLSLTGTSMAAPVVSGAVALMLEANPALTPNLVKAILQYTAQRYSYDALTQGAGFLNARGAVQLARFYARAQAGDEVPSSWLWSKQIIWGNERLSGGLILPTGTAWATNVAWGTAADLGGENIVWGTLCGSSCENIVWGTLSTTENIVWGTLLESSENIVWGTALFDSENIVWGTLLAVENIVWGTACGGDDCENIVWGTALNAENIVWGTALLLENIVWGTSGDGDETIWEGGTWATSGDDAEMFDDPTTQPVSYDEIAIDDLFPPPPTESGGEAALEPMTAVTLEGGF